MNENNIFEGLPGLGDDQALADYMNQQAAAQSGVPEPNVPPMLDPNAGAQPTQSNPGEGQPAPQPQPQAQAPASVNIGGVSYTPEQLQQIIAQNQAYLAQQQQQARQARQSQTNQNQAYSPYQASIIKQLIDRGVPLERIQAAMRGNPQADAMANRIANIEQYIQQQAYAREEQAFITKMTSFGDKFGLSEDDLVTFANAAYAKGINVANVNDVEAVFRAIYPEQYAIRMQRMQTQPSSQMFGGSSMPEAPRAAASKLEDAYVEAFLKGSMPNLYNMNKK